MKTPLCWAVCACVLLSAGQGSAATRKKHVKRAKVSKVFKSSKRKASTPTAQTPDSREAISPEADEPAREAPARTDEEPSRSAPADNEPRVLAETSRSIERRAAPAKAGVSLDVKAGPRMFGRSLKFKDDLFNGLATYALPLAVGFGLNADLFPLASVVSGPLGNLGLTGSFDRAVGLGTRDDFGVVHATVAGGWDAGLKLRVPIDTLEVGGVLGLGGQTFTMGTPENHQSLSPDVDYAFLKAGVTLAYRGIRDVELFGGFDYLLIRSAGMMTSAQYFPRATAGGINLTLGVSYAITPAFGVAASGNLRRYFFSMNSQPGDTAVAGGAIDQYPSGMLSAVVRI